MQVAPSTSRASILLTRISVGSGLIQDRGRSVAPRSALAARVRSGDQGGVQHAREHWAVALKNREKIVYTDWIFLVVLLTLNCCFVCIILLLCYQILFVVVYIKFVWLFCQHLSKFLFGETVLLSYKELIVATNLLLKNKQLKIINWITIEEAGRSQLLNLATLRNKIHTNCVPPLKLCVPLFKT
jgi:hypothetical protein